MNQKLIVGGACVLGMLGAQPLYAQQKKAVKKQQPNVVFILADDLGFGDLSCYGQEKFETPNIDRLALDGKRFTQCYSGTTVSAPSRSSLLTGMHTGHTPIRGNIERAPEGQFPLPGDIRSIFHLFKNAGYTTGAFGKWGLGYIGTTGDPKNMGVDEFYGYNCQLLAHNYYPNHLWHNDQKIELVGNRDKQNGDYAQDLIHDKAIEFLENNKEESFFMYYPAILPHAELIVPEDSIIRKFRGRYSETPYRGDDRRIRQGEYCSQVYPRATFAAMVYRLDVYVGQIVSKLKELGIYENTMIVFASDNGPHCEGGADPDFFNSNGVFRGYKRDLYEGGIRVPMIVTWPNQIASGTETNFMCTFWDLMPTFNELLGHKAMKNVDGISILPTLQGRKNQVEHDYIYFEFMEMNGRQAVRKGDWKLVHMGVRSKAPRFELYNLASDPSEKHNLSTQFPEKVTELKALMDESHVDDSNWPLFGK